MPLWKDPAPPSLGSVNDFQSQPQRRRPPFLHYLSSRYRFSGFLTKAVLTVMTWYLLAFFKKFIYSSVIFHEAESFSCDILKNNVSKADLLRSALWSSALFWIPPRQPTEDISWGEVSLPAAPRAGECEVPPAVSPLLLPKVATRRQHTFMSRGFVLLAKLVFIFSWSRVDFRCFVCFGFAGTWLSYTENCIFSFSGLSQVGSFRLFGRHLRVIQEVLLDYLSDNKL